jgi:zinc/manganese transport system permease protein
MTGAPSAMGLAAVFDWIALRRVRLHAPGAGGHAGAVAGLRAHRLLLVLRRMSLVGDAMAHAVLPGAAAGFPAGGLSLPAMSLGGFVARWLVALAAGFVTRATPQREDASFAAFYLIALALGVLLVSLRGSQVDLMHMLFGSVLAVDDAWRCCRSPRWPASRCGRWRDVPAAGARELRPRLPAQRGRAGGWAHMLLLVLLVANLVSAFQALGTLMAVGLMMLPAAAARFWVGGPAGDGGLSGIGACPGCRPAAELPRRTALGPCIVLVCGAAYMLSVLWGRATACCEAARALRHRTG